MKLHDIKIEHFRSAGSVALNETGDFNVLIGRNNSGKSTILLAIEAFFSCLRTDGLVSLTPPYGNKIDFTGQRADGAISYALTFALSEDERTTLLSDIVHEAQQLRQLIEAVESSLLVEITVCVTPPPLKYSYVRSIRIRGIENGPDQGRTLLSVSPNAADELAKRQKQVDSTSRSVADMVRLEKIDADDFMRLKREDAGESRAYLRFSLGARRGTEFSADVLQFLEQLITSSESFSDFRARIKSVREQMAAEAKSVISQPLANLLQTFSGEQSSAPQYAIRLLQRVASTNILYLTERREPVGRAEATQLLEYKVKRGGNERLQEIQGKIEALLGVRVDAFESGFGTGGDRNAEMDVGDFLLEVNGSGVREALRLILDVELKKPSLLLVEEPEVHLHPALEINMMEYLRDISTTCQVFLTTHSTNFLDLASAQGVYFVTKSNNQTQVKRLNRNEAESDIPRELGIRLSSLFMFDRLVLVEGLSDELVFREFAATLRVNLSEGNVGFAHLGGARNFTHYATEAILSFISKRQIKCTFVIDRDERNDAEVTKMKAALGDRAILHVLKRRELENYLMIAGPLAKFIARKMSFAGAKPLQEIDESTVNAALLKVADQLRVLTYLKHASRQLLGSFHVGLEWQPDSKLEAAPGQFLDEIKRLQGELSVLEGRVPTVVAETKKLIDSNFTRTWSDLVSGDTLLDEVCRKFGTRFKKMIDGPRLAAEFTPNEIDMEIATLIRSVMGKV